MSSFIRREGDEPADVVEGPFAPDCQISVGGEDVLVAVRSGAVLGALGPGRHAPGQPFDLAVFVRRVPQSFRLMRAIGDAARVFGSVRFVIDDPAAFVGALGDPREIHGPGLEHAVVESASELVARAITSAIDQGSTLDAIASQLPRLLGPAAEEWPVPGTRVDLSELTLSVAQPEPTLETGSRASSSSSSDTSETSLIGADVTIPMAGGRRARGVIEELGYLVLLEDGQRVWVRLDDLEIA